MKQERAKPRMLLIGIVHGHGNTITLEVVHFEFLVGAIFTFKLDGQFTFSFGHEIGRLVLITKSMTSNTDRGCPVGDQTRNIGAHNRFAKYRSSQNIPDGAIRASPHLLEAKFLYPFFIRGDGGTFDPNIILFDGLSGIHGDLIIGLIAVFHSEVIIFDVDIQVWKNELLLDEGPNDPGHFITVQFYNGIGYFNF